MGKWESRARHDDAVEDLSELRERITERVVVGSPASEGESAKAGPARALARGAVTRLTRRGFRCKRGPGTRQYSGTRSASRFQCPRDARWGSD